MSKTKKPRRNKALSASLIRLQHDAQELFQNQSFIVFLCGPKLSDVKSSATLRKRLLKDLTNEGFEVVLGEDDGLEELRRMYSGLAHENEFDFILKESCAVVFIADSPGSFCELGLFAYLHYTKNPRQTDFILLMDKKYKGDISYINEGPAKAIDVMNGKVFHGDFSDFNLSELMDRLRTRRTVWINHGKGRPKGTGL